jgi:hypothetical protein
MNGNIEKLACLLGEYDALFTHTIFWDEDEERRLAEWLVARDVVVLSRQSDAERRAEVRRIMDAARRQIEAMEP